MSTRSMIGYLKNDGSIEAIYCHWDGYPENNGVLLNACYKTQKAVENLVSLGNLSSLGMKIYPNGEHSFQNPEPNTCVYYGRDRGETNTEPQNYTDIKMMKQLNDWVEYFYVWNGTEWACFDYELEPTEIPNK